MVRKVGMRTMKKFNSPPTTHFVATVDDLTDKPDFDSEDIDGMDDDAGDNQEPTPIGHWTTTSSHDVYMVDTPKRNNDEDQKGATRDRSFEKQSNGGVSAAPNPTSTETQP